MNAKAKAVDRPEIVESAPRRAYVGMTEDELKRPGAALIQWLLETANSRGHTLKEMADSIGVTYGYIAQMRNGIRSPASISDEFAAGAARYLGVARAAVWFAAGRMTLDDFHDQPETLDPYLDAALSYIRRDPAYSPYMPGSVSLMNRAEKQFIILCYERATGRNLIPNKETVEGMVLNLEGIMSAKPAS